MSFGNLEAFENELFSGVQNNNTKSSSYIPGFGIPSFTTSPVKSSKPGHVSIITSPFLANSATPNVPHLLQSQSNQASKYSKSKKKIIINIINGPVNLNDTQQITKFIDVNQSMIQKKGIQGILQPVNGLQSRESIRNKRSPNENTTNLSPESARSSFDEYDYDYLLFSPPSESEGILNLNSFGFNDNQNTQEISSDDDKVNPVLTVPDPVVPSQLLIGFGGRRSTTRIPFVNKPNSFDHLGDMGLEDSSKKGANQIDKMNGYISFSHSSANNDENNQQQVNQISFGNFSNLISLNQKFATRPAGEAAFKPKEKYQFNPVIQMLSRPNTATGTSNVQNYLRPINVGSSIRDNEPTKIKEYDYDDYFGTNPSSFTSDTTSTPKQPIYEQYPPNSNPYAPRYPYPVYPFFNPATSSASTSCSSAGCAAAAAAASGGSSSSSTSTSSKSGSSSSSSASSGYGGPSSSAAARSSLVEILSNSEIDEWNSFEPISYSDTLVHIANSMPQTKLLKYLPIPGIIQPDIERRRRSPQAYNMIHRMSDFFNEDLDNLEDNLSTTNDSTIVYMNNRVDSIMDSVHSAMDHEGSFHKK